MDVLCLRDPLCLIHSQPPSTRKPSTAFLRASEWQAVLPLGTDRRSASSGPPSGGLLAIVEVGRALALTEARIADRAEWNSAVWTWRVRILVRGRKMKRRPRRKVFGDLDAYQGIRFRPALTPDDVANRVAGDPKFSR